MEKVLYPAGTLSLGASLIYLWEAPKHFGHWWGFGVFFVAMSLALGVYGIALLRWPGRPLAVLGIWGNLAIIVASYTLIRAGTYEGSHGGSHGVALGMVAVIFCAATTALLFGSLGGTGRTLHTAEALSLAAALVHLWEFLGELNKWWGFGAFFLTVCVAQGLYFLLLPHFGRRPLFLLLGIAGNLSIIALWLLTRTAGIPYVRTTGVESFELHTGMVMGVGATDLAATAAETMLIVMLGLLLAEAYRRGEVRLGRRLQERVRGRAYPA